MLSLAQSYAYCERLARREAGNFYHAFRILPGPERRAMCALYAFLRVTDDLADNPGAAADRLADWRRQAGLALTGRYRHRLHPAFHQTVATYRIPPTYLEAVLDGVEMDLQPVSFATFADLYPYCYRVASAVGLACIHIWGFRDDKAKVLAEKAGIAFQLTNILRDLAEDAQRGRVYLPREDLQRFRYREDQLRRGECDPHFRALMQFEVERARRYYDESEPLLDLLTPPGRAVFYIMSRTYRALLDAIERRDYDVFSDRVRLGSWRKMLYVARALPIRFNVV